MKVMMPPRTEIPRNLHDIVTREQDRRHPTPQTVREIEGLHIHRDQPGFTMIYNAHMILKHIKGWGRYGIMYNWTYPASRPPR